MYDLPFARPSFLGLIVFVLVAGFISILAARQRRRRLEQLGRPESVLVLSTLNPKQRRRSRVLLFIGLTLLSVGIAGPRWGKGGNEGVVVGRDLVIVLDFSRSMTLRDMSDPQHAERWQAAQQGLRDLIAVAQQQGGHRLGIVVFAAKPFLICPLTSDYEHVRARLDEFNPHAPPPEIRPDPDEPVTTGTAIGAALQQAVTAHDPRFPGYQDIVLVSDGSGPEIEAESEFGIRLAAERQIPVHVVGVGNPNTLSDLIFGMDDNLEFAQSKLEEGNLKEIARRTKGEYYPARQEVPALGNWFRQVLEPRPSRELSDDALPQPRDRAIWFLLAGCLCIVLAWVREP